MTNWHFKFASIKSSRNKCNARYTYPAGSAENGDAETWHKTTIPQRSSDFHGFVNTVTAYFVADLNWILALGGVIMIAIALSVWYFDKRKAAKQMK